MARKPMEPMTDQTIEGVDVSEHDNTAPMDGGSTVWVRWAAANVLIKAHGAHAPLVPPAVMTLAEAERVARSLLKACANVRSYLDDRIR